MKSIVIRHAVELHYVCNPSTHLRALFTYYFIVRVSFSLACRGELSWEESMPTELTKDLQTRGHQLKRFLREGDRRLVGYAQVVAKVSCWRRNRDSNACHEADQDCLLAFGCDPRCHGLAMVYWRETMYTPSEPERTTQEPSDGDTFTNMSQSYETQENTHSPIQSVSLFLRMRLLMSK